MGRSRRGTDRRGAAAARRAAADGRRRGLGRLTRRRGAALALAVLGLAGIGWATLRPTPRFEDEAALTPLWCLVCGDTGATDVLLNLALFAPFAAGLALLGAGWRRVALVAFLVSACVETAQLAWLPGRDASLSDLLTNTGGATLTAWLVAHRAALLRPGPALARRLALGWLALVVLVLGGTIWLLAPDLPDTSWWGQLAPRFGNYEPFTGTLRSVTLAGTSMRPVRLPAGTPARIRTELARGRDDLVAAELTSGAPTSDLAPIVTISDERQTDLVLLGQDGRDLVWRVRLRAARLRLRVPAVRWAGALPAGAGVPLAFTAGYGHGTYALTREVEGRRDRRSVRARPGWGWAFLWPFGYPALDAGSAGWSLAWLAALALPLGWWWGCGWERRGALVAAILAACYAAITGTGVLEPGGLLELAGLLGGALAGAGGARWVRRRAPAAGSPPAP